MYTSLHHQSLRCPWNKQQNNKEGRGRKPWNQDPWKEQQKCMAQWGIHHRSIGRWRNCQSWLCHGDFGFPGNTGIGKTLPLWYDCHSWKQEEYLIHRKTCSRVELQMKYLVRYQMEDPLSFSEKSLRKGNLTESEAKAAPFISLLPVEGRIQYARLLWALVYQDAKPWTEINQELCVLFT